MFIKLFNKVKITQMKTIKILSFFTLVGILTVFSTQLSFSKDKPNVLIILADDLGWGDVGFNGCTDIPTPNLDKLAQNGIIFEHGYASHSYCSPSRAGLLSGRYQQRFGHENNPTNKVETNESNVGLDLGQLLLSELLHDNGYQTCAIGKWHLGNAPKFWPINRGFDDWYGFTGGGFNYWGSLGNKDKLQGVLRNGIPVPEKEQTYLTDDFSNEAVKYIDKYSKNDKPFFMYLAYNAPHAPIQATKEYVKMVDYIEDGKRAAYAAMVAGMDVGIGKVIDKLKETGEYDNTIIFFYSDNGAHHMGASSLPFRGNKGALFEGGIRVPFMVSWPKGLKGAYIYENPVIALDIYPTILAAIGIKHPEANKLDGINLLPVLKKNKELESRPPLFWRYSGGEGYAVLDGKYKLVRSVFKNKRLLFNLDEDPYEHNDLAEQMPEKVEALQKLYDQWMKGTEQPRWPDDHIQHCIETEKERQSYIDKATSGDKKKISR